jgi:hypothetical protein
MRFYNDTDHRQCPAVDEHGMDCSAPDGHEPPHVSARGEWYDSDLLPADEHHFDVSCDDRPDCMIPQHHAMEDMQ